MTRWTPGWALEMSGRWWAGVAGFWAAYFVVDTLVRALPARDIPLRVAAEGTWWTLLSWLGFVIARRWPLYGPGWRARVAPNLAAWIGITLLHTVFQFIYSKLALDAVSPYWVLAVLHIPSSLLVHMQVIGIAHAAYFSRRWRERAVAGAAAQELLARKRLEILRSRLRPELVYRALDRVAELAVSSPRAADRLVASLGDLLRRALRADADGSVPLGSELGFLEEWIAVENAVRERPLRLEIDADARVLGAAVPSLLLQPVVEVLLHAPQDAPGPLDVRVAARPGADGTGLRVEAELARRSVPGDEKDTDAAIADALRRYYGPAVEVRVDDAPGAMRISLAVSAAA